MSGGEASDRGGRPCLILRCFRGREPCCRMLVMPLTDRTMSAESWVMKATSPSDMTATGLCMPVVGSSPIIEAACVEGTEKCQLGVINVDRSTRLVFASMHNLHSRAEYAALESSTMHTS